MKRELRFPAIRIAALAAASLLLAGCGGSSGPVQNLTGAGATFPYPLYSKWFDTYREETGMQINYQSIGSGAGIQQVKAGTVDFGASDAALSDERLQELPRRVLHFPTAAGAVAMAYNLPGLDGAIRLTPGIVAAIYLGGITAWNDRRIADVNPGTKLPATPVLPIHRSDGSGTTSIFTTYLSLVSPEWKQQVGSGTSVRWPAGVGGKGNEGVAGLVRQTPGAIGYVELAYARQNSLPVARIRNAAGAFVEPTLASTTAAVDASADALAKDVRAPIANAGSPEAYPIAGLTYLLVYQDQQDPERGRAIARFIAWAIHEGQEYAEPLDYARLPASVVKVNEAALRTLTAGGQPVVAGP